MIPHAYCTFFDIGYLSRGIAMIESLREHGDDGKIYLLALDTETQEYFSKFPLQNVQILNIENIEKFNPDLLEIKSERTKMEYYFTITPQLFKFIFSLENIPGMIVTYLDADLYFYSSPKAIEVALGNKSVGISEHRFNSRIEEKLSKYGRFNAGFVCFKNDEQGKKVLSWWADRTLEWCTDVPTEGKYANQGYLNSFPTFQSVKILENAGINFAPWNTSSHNIKTDKNGTILIDGDELVFFHFHGLRKVMRWFVTSQLVYGSPLSQPLRNNIYIPYIQKLQQKEKILANNNGPIPAIKKRGNGIHGFFARSWKFSMDLLSILTRNAIKSS
jgi:hypothetical protein